MAAIEDPGSLEKEPVAPVRLPAPARELDSQIQPIITRGIAWVTTWPIDAPSEWSPS
jgi:hypothetical protein